MLVVVGVCVLVLLQTDEDPTSGPEIVSFLTREYGAQATADAMYRPGRRSSSRRRRTSLIASAGALAFSSGAGD